MDYWFGDLWWWDRLKVHSLQHVNIISGHLSHCCFDLFSISDPCSKHGHFDTGDGGVWNTAWLVLQHRSSSQLWGVAITGQKLRPLHWGFPSGSRFVQKGTVQLLSYHLFVLVLLHSYCLFPFLISVKWVGVGKSRECMVKLYWFHCSFYLL